MRKKESTDYWTPARESEFSDWIDYFVKDYHLDISRIIDEKSQATVDDYIRNIKKLPDYYDLCRNNFKEAIINEGVERIYELMSASAPLIFKSKEMR